jgi:hypothetical protein
MKIYRFDSKSWEDILAMAQDGNYDKDSSWSGASTFQLHTGESSFTKEEFSAEIHKLLKE